MSVDDIADWVIEVGGAGGPEHRLEAALKRLAPTVELVKRGEYPIQELRAIARHINQAAKYLEEMEEAFDLGLGMKPDPDSSEADES